MVYTDISFHKYEYLWKINITIKDDNDYEIGNGCGVLLPEYDMEDHVSAIELADSVTQDAYEVCNGFDPSCLSEQGQIMTMRMVILEKIELDMEYRGNGYGLDVMNDIIVFFSLFPGTIIILQPHPYGKKGNKKEIKKLQDHWKKCGFKQCKKTPYFFRECDEI